MGYSKNNMMGIEFVNGIEETEPNEDLEYECVLKKISTDEIVARISSNKFEGIEEESRKLIRTYNNITENEKSAEAFTEEIK